MFAGFIKISDGGVGVRCVLFFIVVLSVCLCGQVYAADEFAKVPLQVNVLKGVNCDPNDIADAVEEANKILKKAKIHLEFVKDKNIKTGVSDTGDDDGKIAASEEKDLDEAGRGELDDLFKPGRGIKVYITNEIRGIPAYRGLAPHVKIKDGKLQGKPVIYLKKTSATKESRGNDLAHECGHVFTLGKNHWIDKAKGVKADDKWHASDPNNLLYTYNPYTEDGNSHDRGSDLTDDQIKEMQKVAKRLGKAIEAEKPKKPGKSKSSAYQITPIPVIHGGFVDDMYETMNAYADLGAGSFYAETPESELEITLLTEGLFPPTPVNMMVSLYFNSDNNITSGGTFGAYMGIDKIIDVQIFDVHPGGDVMAQLYDVASGNRKFLPGARTERISKIADSGSESIPPLVTDYVDGVYITLEIIELQLSSVVPVFVTIDDFGTGDFDETSFVWELLDNDPHLELADTLLDYGEPLVLSGSGFTPFSDVDILLDDTPLCSGSVTASATGEISATIDIDWVMGGDNFSDDFFFVTARDVSGTFDFSIVEIKRNPANLNDDAVINLLDFSLFIKSFLENDWPEAGFGFSCVGSGP